MTVKELIEQLQSYDPEMEVLVASDAEGNSHLPCNGAYTSQTITDDNYYFDIICDEDIDDMEYENCNVVERCVIYPC